MTPEGQNATKKIDARMAEIKQLTPSFDVTNLQNWSWKVASLINEIEQIQKIYGVRGHHIPEIQEAAKSYRVSVMEGFGAIEEAVSSISRNAGALEHVLRRGVGATEHAVAERARMM